MLGKIVWTVVFVTVAAFLLFVALGFDVEHDITIPPGAAGRHVVVGGQVLRVVDSGVGARSVVLLHGALGSLEDWEAVMPLLAARYRVVAIDRPGHGYSAEPRAVNDVAFNARVVRDVITLLDLKDVVVVGHSYGGSVALRLALDNVPAVRGVVVIAPSAYPDDPADVWPRLINAPLIGRGITRAFLSWIGEERIRRDLTAALAPDGDVVPKGFVDLRVALWKKPVPLRAYAEHRVHLDGDLERMQAGYAKIAKPVVILQGEADAGAATRRGSERLARDIPGATLRTFPATGHYLQYRHPQAVVEAIDSLFGPASRNRSERP